MPRVHRKAKRRLNEELRRDERCKLLKGFWYFPEVKFDETRLRALWNQHRAELMAEWIADYPGTRPWAFWHFDAPDAVVEDELAYLTEHGLADGVEQHRADLWAQTGDFLSPYRP